MQEYLLSLTIFRHPFSSFFKFQTSFAHVCFSFVSVFPSLKGHGPSFGEAIAESRVLPEGKLVCRVEGR
jgi:hypothetical protein